MTVEVGVVKNELGTCGPHCLTGRVEVYSAATRRSIGDHRYANGNRCLRGNCEPTNIAECLARLPRIIKEVPAFEVAREGEVWLIARHLFDRLTQLLHIFGAKGAGDHQEVVG